MEMANEKLSNLVQQQACDRSLSINPLSMMLSGIVDPAVMGGFSNYEKVGAPRLASGAAERLAELWSCPPQAFFTDAYIQEHPEDQERIEVLKHLIALQVTPPPPPFFTRYFLGNSGVLLQIPLLADGIRIHGEKATEQLRPLHNRLVTCFQDLREKVEKHYGVITLVRLRLCSSSMNLKPRPFPTHVSPVCLVQPCSLMEKKKSRVGSVVMPYILSSALRRMSTISTVSSTSSGLSSGSASSDSPAHQESVDGQMFTKSQVQR